MKNILYISFALFLPMVAFAQSSEEEVDTISNTVVVTKEYNPTIDDAEKISLRPEEKAQALVNKSIRYKVKVSEFYPTKQVEKVKPVPVAKEYVISRFNPNYIKGGLGTRSSIYSELFYNAYSTDVHNFNVYGFHNSTFGKVKLQDGNKVWAPNSRSNATLSYENRQKAYVFQSDLQLNHLGVRYYGSDSIKKDTEYLTPEFETTYDSLLKPSTTQHYRNVILNASLFSQNTDVYEFRYLSNLNFHAHANSQGFTEYKTHLSGDFSTPIGTDGEFGMGLSSKYYSYSLDNKFVPTFGYYTDYLSLSSLNGVYTYRQDQWQVTAGVEAFFLTSEVDDPTVVMAPKIDASMEIIEDLIRVYAKVGGDYRYADYKDNSMKFQFLSHNLLTAPTKVPLAIDLGVDGYVRSDLFFNLNFAYEVFKDEHFFANYTVLDAAEMQPKYTNRLTAIYDDGSLFSLDANLMYQGFKNTEIGMSTTYKKYNLDNLEKAWYKPEMQFNAFASYSFARMWTIKGGYELVSTQYTGDSNVHMYKLPVIHDVNLEGVYEYSSIFSGFVRGQNLLNRQNYLFNGYPMHGILFLAGVKYSF